MGFVVALVAIGTLAAACGGGSGSASPGVANVGSVANLGSNAGAKSGTAGSQAGSTATTAINPLASGASGEVEAALLRYAHCMQTHGEPNYPSVPADDPSAMNKIDQSSPQYVHANEACRKDLPHVAPVPPAYRAAEEAKELKWAHCMQTHGMPNWPDPYPNGGFLAALGGSAASSPAYKRAIKTCKHLWP